MLLPVFVYVIPIVLTIISGGVFQYIALLPAIPRLAGLSVAETREKALVTVASIGDLIGKD